MTLEDKTLFISGGSRGIGLEVALRAAIPVRRIGRPDEVARVVGFLAADASGYITGQAWAVKGGVDM